MALRQRVALLVAGIGVLFAVLLLALPTHGRYGVVRISCGSVVAPSHKRFSEEVDAPYSFRTREVMGPDECREPHRTRLALSIVLAVVSVAGGGLAYVILAERTRE